MFALLSNRASILLIRKKIISVEEIEIYAYGFELLLSSLANGLLIMTLALLYGRPIDAVVYMLCAKPLRRYGGGWHASSHAACMTFQCISFSSVSWLCYFIGGNIPFLLFLAMHVLCLALTIWRAPVEHPDNPIIPHLRKGMRRKCIVIHVFMLIISFILFITKQETISALLLFSIIISVSTFLFRNKPNNECIQSNLVQIKQRSEGL